jgi:hypothetical protein
VTSFTSSIHSVNDAFSSAQRLRRDDIKTKIECVDSLAALMHSNDRDQISRKLEAMSLLPANCNLMREKRVLHVLMQLMHSSLDARNSREVRVRAARTMRNMVQVWSGAVLDRSEHKKEVKVLRLLEMLRMFSDVLRDLKCSNMAEASKTHGCQRIWAGTAGRDGSDVDLIVYGEFIECQLDLDSVNPKALSFRFSMCGIGSVWKHKPWHTGCHGARAEPAFRRRCHRLRDAQRRVGRHPAMR